MKEFPHAFDKFPMDLEQILIKESFTAEFFILALIMDELAISKTSTVKHVYDRIVPGEKFSVDSIIGTVSCAILSALGRPITY